MSILCQKQYAITVGQPLPLFLSASPSSGVKQGTAVTLTAVSFPPASGSCPFYWGNPVTDIGSVFLGTSPFVGGTAILITSAIPVGTKSLFAYAPIPAFTLSNEVFFNCYTLVLTSNSSDIRLGIGCGPGPFTYTATVFAGATPMVGTVNFIDDLGNIGSASLIAGVASVSPGLQTPFFRTVTCTYTGGTGSTSIQMYIAPDLQIDGTMLAYLNTFDVGGFTGRLRWSLNYTETNGNGYQSACLVGLPSGNAVYRFVIHSEVDYNKTVPDNLATGLYNAIGPPGPNPPNVILTIAP